MDNKIVMRIDIKFIQKILDLLDEAISNLLTNDVDWLLDAVKNNIEDLEN